MSPALPFLVVLEPDTEFGSANVIGNKNASLVELSRLGLHIPNSFALTTAFTQAFMERNAIRPKLLKFLDEVDYVHSASVIECSMKLRLLIESGDFPVDFQNELLGDYTTLGKKNESSLPKVSVRSSARLEDLEFIRLAGAYETILGVSGEEKLIEAVKRCLSSMYTPVAMTMRHTFNLSQDPIEIGMSVGVCSMVEADVAGAAFGADPMTGEMDSIIIEANWGLGASVMDGSSLVDHFVVRKSDGVVMDRLVKRKNTMVIMGTKNGISVAETPSELIEIPTLDDSDLARIALYYKMIEKHYEKPMDVEWAIERGSRKLFFLQARPISHQKTRGG